MKNIIKPILLFSVISIGLDAIKNLIYSEFNLAIAFSPEVLIYEGFCLIVTALLTYTIIKNIAKDNLGISLVKAITFGIIYALISLIVSRIYIKFVGLELKFDICRDFLKFIPNGIAQGIILMFVLLHFYPKSTKNS